jgi:hypothetical protein
LPITIPQLAIAIEHARDGAYPSREAVSMNEAWRQLWLLLRRGHPTGPQLHLVGSTPTPAGR